MSIGQLERREFERDLVCKCGRDSFPRTHCPSCGSVSTYAAKRLNLDKREFDTDDEGNKFVIITTIKGFRCRDCGIEYREDTECFAPTTRGINRQSTGVIQTTVVNRDSLLRTCATLYEGAEEQGIESQKRLLSALMVKHGIEMQEIKDMRSKIFAESKGWVKK